MVFSHSWVLNWALRLVCGLLFAALASHGFAQQTPPIVKTESGALQVELAGHRLVFPQPTWTVVSAEPIEQAKVRYNEVAPNVHSIVLLPVDATVVNWTHLMGVLVVGRADYTRDTQLASVIDPMMQACANDAFTVATFGTEEKGAVVAMCGRYRPGAEGIPVRCGGGVILATVLASPKGSAKVYDEWCTPGFSPDDIATWPVPEPDLSRYAEILVETSTFEPIEGTN